jgi:hypothetical protein
MTHQITRPDWVSDDLVAERGPHAGFSMYSTEGNDAVADMVIAVIARAETGMLPKGIKALLREGVANVAIKFPEVHDTEPEWAIVDAMNEWLAPNGFANIDRDDLF